MQAKWLVGDMLNYSDDVDGKVDVSTRTQGKKSDLNAGHAF